METEVKNNGEEEEEKEEEKKKEDDDDDEHVHNLWHITSGKRWNQNVDTLAHWMEGLNCITGEHFCRLRPAGSDLRG